MTDEDEPDRKGGLPPGGRARQRRQAFLEKRGLPLDEELEDEDEATEDEEQPGEGADPTEPEDGSVPD